MEVASELYTFYFSLFFSKIWGNCIALQKLHDHTAANGQNTFGQGRAGLNLYLAAYQLIEI